MGEKIRVPEHFYFWKSDYNKPITTWDGVGVLIICTDAN